MNDLVQIEPLDDIVNNEDKSSCGWYYDLMIDLDLEEESQRPVRITASPSSLYLESEFSTNSLGSNFCAERAR